MKLAIEKDGKVYIRVQAKVSVHDHCASCDVYDVEPSCFSQNLIRICEELDDIDGGGYFEEVTE